MPYFSVQGNSDIHAPHRYSGTLVPPSSSRASPSSSKQRTWRSQYTHLPALSRGHICSPTACYESLLYSHARWKAYRSRANCVSRRMGTAWNQRGLPDSATITVTEEQSMCLLSSDVQTAFSVEVISFNPRLVLQRPREVDWSSGMWRPLHLSLKCYLLRIPRKWNHRVFCARLFFHFACLWGAGWQLLRQLLLAPLEDFVENLLCKVSISPMAGIIEHLFNHIFPFASVKFHLMLYVFVFCEPKVVVEYLFNYERCVAFV